MECRRLQRQAWIELTIEGRLDALWSERLELELSEILRDGARQIRLEMSGINFLSSAGIRILLKYRKELAALDGCLMVVSPSEQVSGILKMTGMLALLDPPQSEGEAHSRHGSAPSGARIPFDGGSMAVYKASPGAKVAVRTEGRPRKAGEAAYSASHRLELPPDVMALGLGGFGDSFTDCRQRFGEFMALGGNAITLPPDSGEIPDFLAGVADFVPSVQTLYAIVCQGPFASFCQFSANVPGESVTFSALAEAAFAICKSDCIAVAMVAETAGLVGASLLRSPALPDASEPLEFPVIRDYIALTSEPAWPHSMTLVCGIALKGEESQLSPFLHPLGGDNCSGHFHAAPLSYHALPDGLLELAPTVTGLLETQNLQGLFHLINDTRQITGIGESRFLRGALWCGPATMQEVTG